MTPAKPAGSVLAEASRVVGLELFDRVFDLLDSMRVRRGSALELAGSPAETAQSDERRPAPLDRAPARRSGADPIALMDRVLLCVLVLWVPLVCAWWAGSVPAVLPVLVWYVAVAPILLRNIWKKAKTPLGVDVEG
jgi:hypothetical protein